MNGFSNEFWGWGGEDWDAWNRAWTANLYAVKASVEGRYVCLQNALNALTNTSVL